VLPFDEIGYVLLDLDGTLLDKNFDDTFWLELVPERYASARGIGVDEAREHLFRTYRSHEGTLKWTDLDFWSEELRLDIPGLKRELGHLIGTLPHAEDFLEQMRSEGREVHLLTNAHHKSVSLKFELTGIGRHFNSVLTSNELGAPKETPEYWEKASEMAGFDPGRSLFVDDTEDVLRAARKFGVRYVVHKARSSSVKEPEGSGEFPSITDFDEFLAAR
jgi:putative hydrolase of the HAD superfamily